MTTRIFDIDLAETDTPFVVPEPYSHALFLIRSRGRPIGKVTVPVTNGHTHCLTLQRKISADMLTLAVVNKWQARLASTEVPPLPTATVAICTRERPDDLRRALASLTAPPQGEDVIVIDNCPTTDATRDVVAEFPGVRYVMEPKKGLNNARNRAIAETSTEVLAFIDDDAMADPYWLADLVRPFADARVQCTTGLTMPLELESEAQEKFESLSGFSKRGFYGRSFRSPPQNPLIVGDIGAGVNMALRLSFAAKIGPVDPALDAGTATQSGGDHEYFTRILKHGGTIEFTPLALNWHRHRRNWEDLQKALWGYGVGVCAAWTSTFLADRDWGVFRCALGWFRYYHAPMLLRTYFGPQPEVPKDILWGQIRGCLHGPFAYLKARKAAGGTRS